MRRCDLRSIKGVTLIELIVTVSIVAIITAATAGIIIYLMQLFIYMPRDIKTRAVADEIIYTMTEGESLKRGMRYSVQILDASPGQFSYTSGYPGNDDRRNIRFQLNNGKIYRYATDFGSPLDGPQPLYGPAETIPYYVSSDIVISGKGADPSAIFTYFKEDGSLWVSGTDPLYKIRRVEIGMAVKSGAGIFRNWEGSFYTTAGVEIKQYI